MIDKFKRAMALKRSSKDIVKLFADEVSAEDKERIRNWKSESQEYTAHYVATNHLIADLEALALDEELMAVVEAKVNKVQVVELRTRRWPALAVAASLILAVVATLQPWSSRQDSPVVASRYVTRIGEQKTVNLDDGTVISINTATELLVDYRDDIRHVTLRRGEAYFEVAKDSQRPFTVDAGERAVTVLGTEFNLYKAPDKLELVVAEGLVSVHYPESSVSPGNLLTPPQDGSQITLAASNQHRVGAGTVLAFDVKSESMTAYHSDEVNHLSSWKNGVIRFSAVPLSEVVQKLNRYTGKKILIEDTEAMELRLFATVRLDRIDDALTVIEMSLPIRVVRHFDRVVIAKKIKISNEKFLIK